MVRVHHHKTGVHKSHKKRATKHKGKTTGHKGHVGTGAVTGNAVLAALMNDPAAMKQLTDAMASNLFSSGFTEEIVDAIEAVVGTTQSSAAGRLLAGQVSTLTGALELNGSSQPIVAMVFLGGAATAVACYVPTHLRASIATGLDVWVEPINGDMSDLVIVCLRNVF